MKYPKESRYTEAEAHEDIEKFNSAAIKAGLPRMAEYRRFADVKSAEQLLSELGEYSPMEAPDTIVVGQEELKRLKNLERPKTPREADLIGRASQLVADTFGSRFGIEVEPLPIERVCLLEGPVAKKELERWLKPLSTWGLYLGGRRIAMVFEKMDPALFTQVAIHELTHYAIDAGQVGQKRNAMRHVLNEGITEQAVVEMIAPMLIRPEMQQDAQAFFGVSGVVDEKFLKEILPTLKNMVSESNLILFPGFAYQKERGLLWFLTTEFRKALLAKKGEDLLDRDLLKMFVDLITGRHQAEFNTLMRLTFGDKSLAILEQYGSDPLKAQLELYKVKKYK